MGILQIVKRAWLSWLDVERKDMLIILVVLFAFLIRIIFLFYTPLRGWDETVYLNLGYQLSQNPLIYSLANSGWSDFIPSQDTIYGWPSIGFRAPLLPYLISVFYSLNLNFIVEIINPFLGAVSVFLVYILGKKLFDNNVGLYSATLFSLVPLHVYFSEQVLTDTFVVFFLLLTFVSFWEGYEKGNTMQKILFGLFFALSLLARYTTLWIAVVFFLYFFIRDRSLKFLTDKYLWYAISFFFVILAPWFIYSFAYYGNTLGAFVHGFRAASYWGGVQSWNFFFINSWHIFSAVGVVFIFSLIYIFFKKEFYKREVYLLLIWTFFFLGMAIYMPHKEERFIMPIIPAVCLISGFCISKFKRYKNTIFGLICAILIISLFGLFKIEYEKSKNKANICFSEGNKFLASDSINKNSLVITNQSPIVYYYTQKENRIYPDPWSVESLKNIINLNHGNRIIYIFFTNYDMSIDSGVKNDLDNNFKKVFECSKDWGYSAIYE